MTEALVKTEASVVLWGENSLSINTSSQLLRQDASETDSAMRIHLMILLTAAALLSAADPAAVRIPLSVFNVAAGDAITIDDRSEMADPAGLLLTPGRALAIGWKARGRQQRHTILVTTAANGAPTPSWHADAVRQDGNAVVVVGSSTAGSVTVAYDRALLDARTQAAQAAGTTTVTEANGVRTVRSTTAAGTAVGGQVRDVVIQVSADPSASAPVTCWVRMQATVTTDAASETPAMKTTREGLEKAVREGGDKAGADLDRVLTGAVGGQGAEQSPAERAAQAQAEKAAEAAAEKAARETVPRN